MILFNPTLVVGIVCASLIREVAEKSKHQLALAGKMMGLCGYGKVVEEHVPALRHVLFDKDYKKLAQLTGLPLKNLDDPWGSYEQLDV